MGSLTIVPIDLIGYGAPVLGVLGIVLWWRVVTPSWSSTPTPTWAKASGWLGLVLVVAGGFSFPIKYDMQGRAAHEASFAELPTEWQDFYNGMNKVDFRLHSEAIKRFTRTVPPQLTPENYAALTGSHRTCGETAAMRSIQKSRHIDDMVKLDFAEGK